MARRSVMRRRGKVAATLLVTLALLAAACASPPNQPAAVSDTEIGALPDNVDEKIHALMLAGEIPSLAAAIVVDDSLVWAKGYGEQPTLDTVFAVGSVEKTFVATAVLQLYERGMIDLDDDVSDYLPLEVRHPDYPDTAVTIRMLLAHRAGLAHDAPLSRYYNQDGPMLRWRFWNLGYDLDNLLGSFRILNREEFLRATFSNAADDSSGVWKSEPGTAYQYSNVGLQGLLPYLVEQVAGKPFAGYVQENILDSLVMPNTGFEASDFGERLAIPHERVDGELRELPRTGWSASGRMRSTASDLAQFLSAHANGGANGEGRILQPETVELMHGLVSPLDWPAFFGLHWEGYGLGWERYSDGFQGHPGACPGYLTNIVYREAGDSAYGVVLLANRGASIDTVDWAAEHYAPILLLLLDEAAEIHATQAEQ